MKNITFDITITEKKNSFECLDSDTLAVELLDIELLVDVVVVDVASVMKYNPQ